MSKVEMYSEWDWENIPTGSTFEAEISGVKLKGRIFKTVDGYIYLCQNEISGYDAPVKLGYRYSWIIGAGTVEKLKRNNVKYLQIWLPEEGYQSPKLDLTVVGDYAVEHITKDEIKVCCTRVRFEQVEKIYHHMLKLRRS